MMTTIACIFMIFLVMVGIYTIYEKLIKGFFRKLA